MASHMSDQGFNLPDCSLFGCVDSPSTAGPGSQKSIAIGREVTPRLELRAVLEFGDLGWASGTGQLDYVAVQWKATSVGTVMSFTPSRTFRIGAGPMIARLVSAEGLDPEAPRVESAALRPGILFETGFRTSAAKRLFVDLAAAYRLIARRDDGPHGTGLGPGATLSAISLGFSHLTFAAGLGIRW
jgi:hypothetical protein